MMMMMMLILPGESKCTPLPCSLLLLLRHVSVVSLSRFKFHFISHFSVISYAEV
jgi:hypothetical protein